jgi:urocanate hydratase
MLTDREKFKQAVKDSLIRHVVAINKLTLQGMYFWDYGNAFLKEAGMAGADIFADDQRIKYRYPSYVEDIMGYALTMASVHSVGYVHPAVKQFRHDR